MWTSSPAGREISYEPVGSEEGRRRFVDGEVAFAASDAPLEGAELTDAVDRCKPGELIELPVYISPIVVFANLKLTAMELSPQTLSKVLRGEITRWDDPTIKRENPSIGPIGLPPKLAISPIGLSAEPTMTEQLTTYLDTEAASAWQYGVSGSWPVEGGETAEDAASVDQAVGAKDGTISYTDFSHVGELFGVTRLAVRGGFFLEPTAQDTTKRLGNAHLDTALRKGPRMLPVELEQKAPSGSYPLALVSYLIACSEYDSESETAAMDAYVKYVAGRQGQIATAEQVGSAFPPRWLSKQVFAAIR